MGISPAALAPDEDYDKIGCFSGSAIELDDGRQLLMYTAVDYETLEDGSKRDIQTQAVAVGDGRDYVKYEKNPVLTEKDLPEGASKVDFRDPKIWKGKDGNFYCVIGSRPADGSGQILLTEVQMDLTGNLSASLQKIRNVLERCGSVRISLNWMENTFSDKSAGYVAGRLGIS